MFKINQVYVLNHQGHRNLTWCYHRYRDLANTLLDGGDFEVKSVNSTGHATKIHFVGTDQPVCFFDIPVTVPVELFRFFVEVPQSTTTPAVVVTANNVFHIKPQFTPALALEIPGVKIFPFDNEKDLLDNLCQAQLAVVELRKLTKGYQGIVVHWLGKRYKLTGHQACLDFIRWYDSCVDVQARYETISKFEEHVE